MLSNPRPRSMCTARSDRRTDDEFRRAYAENRQENRKCEQRSGIRRAGRKKGRGTPKRSDDGRDDCGVQPDLRGQLGDGGVGDPLGNRHGGDRHAGLKIGPQIGTTQIAYDVDRPGRERA